MAFFLRDRSSGEVLGGASGFRTAEELLSVYSPARWPASEYEVVETNDDLLKMSGKRWRRTLRKVSRANEN